jgi:hypothetical protein
VIFRNAHSVIFYINSNRFGIVSDNNFYFIMPA